MPGRLITDNVLVAYETLHTMHCKKKGKKWALALKLDISKAYDHVEWPFLKEIMHKLGLPERWIDRVMSCVTTPSFSVLNNGKPHGNIHPSRGIRQGDPLSPYLFLFCAEGFTPLLTKADLEGKIHGVSICRRAPKSPTCYLLMTHCYFAEQLKLKWKYLMIFLKHMLKPQVKVSTWRSRLYTSAAISLIIKRRRSSRF